MFVKRVKTAKDKAEVAYEKAKEVGNTAKKGYKTVKKLFDKTEEIKAAQDKSIDQNGLYRVSL